MRKLFLLLLFFTLGYSVNAQTEEVKECISLNGVNSLIVDWLDIFTVAYTEDKNLSSAVFIAETSSPYNERKVFLPFEMRVRDLDSYTENLMFCGVWDSSGHKSGVVGRLQVPNSFTWGQSMEYFRFSPFVVQGCQVTITDMKRIVFLLDTISNMDYFWMASVGECLIKRPNETVDTGTVICDILYNYSNWYIYVYVDLTGEEMYTDITSTDNYVIAVGYGKNNNCLIIKQFDCQYPFINHPSTYNNISRVFDDTIWKNVLVEALGEDKFATINYYSNSVESGSALKIFNGVTGVPVLQNSMHMPHDYIKVIPKEWSLRELKFEKEYNLLYVLQNVSPIEIGSFVSVVNEYDMANLSQQQSLTSWVEGMHLYGMNLWGSGGFQTVGSKNDKMVTYKKLGALLPQKCIESIKLPYYFNEPVVDVVQCDEMVVSLYRMNILYPFSPVNVKIDTKCINK